MHDGVRGEGALVERNVDDELEQLVAKVRAEQEAIERSLKPAEQEPERLPVTREPEEEAAPPAVIAKDERGRFRIVGRDAVEKARVAAAFTAGMATMYLFSTVVVIVAAGAIGYGAYHFFRSRGDEDEVIDVDGKVS